MPSGSITYKSALERIEINCLNPVNSPEGRRWWDVAIAPTDIEAELVAQAVVFLQNSGRVIHHPRLESWIHILEECACMTGEGGR